MDIKITLQKLNTICGEKYGRCVVSKRNLVGCSFEVDFSSWIGKNLSIGVSDSLPVGDDHQVMIPGLMHIADDLNIRYRLGLGLTTPYMTISTGYFINDPKNPLFVVVNPNESIATDVLLTIVWDGIDNVPEQTGLDSEFGQLYQAMDYWRTLTADREDCGVDVWILPRDPWLNVACEMISRDIAKQTERGDRLMRDFLKNRDAYRKEYRPKFKKLFEEKGRYLIARELVKFENDGVIIDQGDLGSTFVPYTPNGYQQLDRSLTERLDDIGGRILNAMYKDR